MTRIALATLCLNESEWIEKNYQQHKDWPGLCAWIFVEGADYVYQQCNPELVSPDGLSVDDTSKLLGEIAARDGRVRYLPHGTGGGPSTDPAQNKCFLRDAYLSALNRLAGSEWEPDYLIVIDADEFWPKASQEAVVELLGSETRYTAYDFQRREIWRPPTINCDLFDMEVVGGYWAVPHTRVWRWRSGLTYREHNTPGNLNTRTMTFRGDGTPHYCHLGFASRQGRFAKHRYYESRGEGKTDHRKWYVECRKAWETWERFNLLPHGARVVKYIGPIPEVFQESK